MTSPDKANDDAGLRRVVYLFGAGASHACAQDRGSSYGILMQDLGLDLARRVRELVEYNYQGEMTLRALANTVIDESTDFEHIITFLDESTSALHRQFAENLRQIFHLVLSERLRMIEEELGEPPIGLYLALLDMHQVPGCTEELAGILTINYDEYLETALEESYGEAADFGIRAEGLAVARGSPRLLKLHGSFGWRDLWPIGRGQGESPLWIPPGILKAKDRYPFNVLWGLARELLDCDVLRIVGCGLGANDWDLISLLFTTRHTNATRIPYQVQIIDSPHRAQALQEEFPYLEAQSILEADPVGRWLISEYSDGRPRSYNELTPEEQRQVLDNADRNDNWFRLWLKHMAEVMYRELGSVDTPRGTFRRLLEAV